MGMLGDTKARRPFELPGCTVVGEVLCTVGACVHFCINLGTCRDTLGGTG